MQPIKLVRPKELWKTAWGARRDGRNQVHFMVGAGDNAEGGERFAQQLAQKRPAGEEIGVISLLK